LKEKLIDENNKHNKELNYLNENINKLKNRKIDIKR
jgi:hypothetical protein